MTILFIFRVMESSVCRVCLGTGEDLVNIFEESVGFGVSIAGMVSKCIGLKVEKGDRLPENICPPCLQGVKDAIEDLLEKEVCKEPDTEGRIINLDATEIKEEFVDDFREKEFQCQVKNEPLEEDVFEKEYNPIPESDSDPCEIQMKIEIEEYDWQGLRESDDDYESANDNDENTSLHKCSCCSKTFTSKSALRYHLKKHSRGRPFKCTQCSKTFTHNCYLKRHFQAHTGTGERPFKCSLCPKTFQFNSALQVFSLSFEILTTQNVKKKNYTYWKFFYRYTLLSWSNIVTESISRHFVPYFLSSYPPQPSLS